MMEVWVVIEREKDIGPEERISVLKVLSNKEEAERFIEEYVKQLSENTEYIYYEAHKENSNEVVEFGYIREDGWHEIFAQKSEINLKRFIAEYNTVIGGMTVTTQVVVKSENKNDAKKIAEEYGEIISKYDSHEWILKRVVDITEAEVVNKDVIEILRE